MGLFVADGIEAIDVTLFGGPPVGVLRVELQAGLTVLYGENGAGKSRVLDGIAAALTGVARSSGGSAVLRCRLANYWSEYDTTLVVRLARFLRVAASAIRADMSGPPDPGWVDEDEDPAWENAAQELDPFFEEDWADDPGGTDHMHSILMVQLEADLELLGSHHGKLGGSHELALMPVGTTQEPRWDVFLSTILDDTAALRFKASDDFSSDDRRFCYSNDLIRFAASTLELWTPRVAFIGTISPIAATRVLRGDIGRDVDRATAVSLRSAVPKAPNGQSPILASYSEEGFTFDLSFEVPLRRLEVDATCLFQKMIDTTAMLCFDVHDPSEWPFRGLGTWMVHETDGLILQVDAQGSARRRWAQLAIEMTLPRNQFNTPAILVLDEPENALHQAAQAHLTRGLSFQGTWELGPRVVASGIFVATHSPALLAAEGAHLVHVHRSDGETALSPVIGLAAVDAVVEQLGASRADILMMTKSFILVEGEHDKIVLTRLFGEELDRHRARVLVMRGAKRATAMLDLELLARYSEARLVLVIDRLGREASAIWEEASLCDAKGDRLAAERCLHQLDRLPGGEGRWMAEAGLAALAAGRLSRVRLVGLERRDILEYLPVTEMVPGAASWEALRAEHQGSHAKDDFKTWLRNTHSARITPAAIANAAGKVDDLQDLPALLLELR